MDGSRIEGTIPSTTPDDPSMAIRKHASATFPLSRCVEEERISLEGAEYLRGAIRNARNILVAGGTRSGKTTFVNALIKEGEYRYERVYGLNAGNERKNG